MAKADDESREIEFAGQGYEEALRRIKKARRTGEQSLHLMGLGLTALPPEIGTLQSLAALYLTQNGLAALPPEIGHLTALRGLYLAANQFAELPPEVCRLTALTGLYLRGNRLAALPPEVGNLTALTELYLGDNGLAALPPEFGHLTALTWLDLHNNRLTALPPEIRRLEKLTGLFLHDNPGLGLPSEILGPGWEDVKSIWKGVASKKAKPKPPREILDYYFSTAAGSRVLRELKLILVGRGEVGKTTLAEALQGKPFRKNRPRTDGIRITPWKVEPAGGDAVVRIWDFGGQEIMHGTHQFFLTRRAAYVVMVDGRDDRYQREAEYWLKLVRAFGGDSAVMVVMNRQKSYKFDLDRNGLATKYGVSPDLFFPTECSRGATVTPVRRALLRVVGDILSAQANFPAKWWAIKTRLEGMREDYLSEKAYRDLCASGGVTDAAEQDQLLDRLNDLGTVVHFADDPLCDLKVLNPEWATDGVYRVVTNETLREEKRGKLKFAALKDILPRARWPEAAHRRYVLDLMQRFDLCFPAEGEPDVYIVPELLPEQTPELTGWDPKAGVVFRYQYPVLPHGILPRFISKTHALSEGRERWRSGVVVAKDGAEALVRADYDASTVDIWVRGQYRDERRALLTIIRDKFDEIHGRFKDLDPPEMVGVPGHPAIFVPYDDLILDERDGQTTYRVTIEGKRLEVSLSDLLDGVASPEERKRAARRAAAGRSDLPTGATVIDKSLTIVGDVTDSQVAGKMKRARNRAGRPAGGEEG